MATTHTEDVPLSILDGSDGMMRVTFTFSPGRAAVGPAYDHGGLPAEPPEIEIVETRYMDGTLGLAEQEEVRVIEWLLENFEEPTGPDADEWRDRRRDEALTERDDD
jgi:hypothetical protein